MSAQYICRSGLAAFADMSPCLGTLLMHVQSMQSMLLFLYCFMILEDLVSIDTDCDYRYVSLLSERNRLARVRATITGAPSFLWAAALCVPNGISEDEERRKERERGFELHWSGANERRVSCLWK